MPRLRRADLRLRRGDRREPRPPLRARARGPGDRRGDAVLGQYRPPPPRRPHRPRRQPAALREVAARPRRAPARRAPTARSSSSTPGTNGPRRRCSSRRSSTAGPTSTRSPRLRTTEPEPQCRPRSSSTSAPTRRRRPLIQDTLAPNRTRLAAARARLSGIGPPHGHHRSSPHWMSHLPQRYRDSRPAGEHWRGARRATPRGDGDGDPEQRGILPRRPGAGRHGASSRAYVAAFGRRRDRLRPAQPARLHPVDLPRSDQRQSGCRRFDIPRARRCREPVMPRACSSTTAPSTTTLLAGFAPEEMRVPLLRGAGGGRERHDRRLPRRARPAAAGLALEPLPAGDSNVSPEPLAAWAANQVSRAADRRAGAGARWRPRPSPRNFGDKAAHDALHPAEVARDRASTSSRSTARLRGALPRGSTRTSRWRRSSSRPGLVHRGELTAFCDPPRPAALRPAPASEAERDGVRVVLHIGTHKTGTTALQASASPPTVAASGRPVASSTRSSHGPRVRPSPAGHPVDRPRRTARLRRTGRKSCSGGGSPRATPPP